MASGWLSYDLGFVYDIMRVGLAGIGLGMTDEMSLRMTPAGKCGEELLQDSHTRTPSILHVHQQRLPLSAAHGSRASPDAPDHTGGTRRWMRGDQPSRSMNS